MVTLGTGAGANGAEDLLPQEVSARPARAARTATILATFIFVI